MKHTRCNLCSADNYRTDRHAVQVNYGDLFPLYARKLFDTGWRLNYVKESAARDVHRECA